jgi:hypothetical protein
MTESRSSTFVMYGSRAAISAGLSHIEEHVKAIEHAVAENHALVFDLARTLVESTCKAVLNERKIAYTIDDDLPQLFRSASRCVPFLPQSLSCSAEARASLRRTLQGLSTTIHGICELRNRCGFASHGTGSQLPKMESAQVLLVAAAADTIVGFLYRVHRQDPTLPTLSRELYDASGAFNESVDREFGPIRIFRSEFRASEVLFALEPETYRIHLVEYGGGQGEVDPAPADPSEVTP